MTNVAHTHTGRKILTTVPGSDGVDWTDAGIGAGLAFAFVLVVAGARTAFRRRHFSHA